jgi:hypothetical protein
MLPHVTTPFHLQPIFDPRMGEVPDVLFELAMLTPSRLISLTELRYSLHRAADSMGSAHTVQSALPDFPQAAIDYSSRSG